MKRLFIVLAMLLAIPAYATDWYVVPTGADGNAGTSRLVPFRSIGKANKVALPGDRVYVFPSYFDYYGDFPNPDSGGSNPTGGGRITYIGASDEGDPLTNDLLKATIKINGGSLTKKYVVIKGMHVIGSGLNFAATADRDSVTACIVDNGLSFTAGGRYSVFDQSIYTGQWFTMGVNEGGILEGTRVTANLFSGLGKNYLNNNDVLKIGGGAPGGHTDSCVIADNHFIGVIENYFSDRSFYKRFLSTYFVQTRNNWDVENKRSDGGSPHVFYERDSCSNNTIRRDTMYAHGSGYAMYALVASGHFTNSCKNLTVDSCDIRLLGDGGGDVTAEARVNGLTFTNNVCISKFGKALRLSDIKEKTLIAHNTLVGTANYGVLDLRGESTIPAWTDTVKVISNICYAIRWDGYPVSPRLYEQPAPYCYPDFGITCGRNFAVTFSPEYIDSAHTQIAANRRKHVINGNVYAYYGSYKWPFGDRSIGLTGGSNFNPSYPGKDTTNASTNPAYSWFFDYYLQDSLSVYGSPRFGWSYTGTGDSTATNFDPRLGYGSAAIGIGMDKYGNKNSSDAGALAYALQPILTTRSIVHMDGDATGATSVRIYNGGGANLVVSAVTSSNSTFAISGISLPKTITPGSYTEFVITFTADGTTQGSQITITSNDTTYPVWVITAEAKTTGGGGTIEP